MKNFPGKLTTSSQKEVILDNTRLLLAFKKPATEKEISSAIKEFGLVIENISDKKAKNKHWNKVNNTPTRFWVKSTAGIAISDKEFSLLHAELKSKLDWIGPVYSSVGQENAEQKFCPLPNVLLLEKSEKQKKQQDEIIEKFKLREVLDKSRYMTKYRYFIVQDPLKTNVYQLRELLSKAGPMLAGVSVRFENMPMMKPLTSTTPDDTLWGNQWNMAQINAPDAWDISRGVNSVVICILDEGCDLTHPDLVFAEDGINLGSLLPTGAPTGDHGTACAGIAAATFNNNEGVAGLAGNCTIMPLAFSSWTDVECANGINYATINGASVISMSFGVYDDWGWDYSIIDPEIQRAFDNDVVMCAATGNEDTGATNRYPGKHPLVIAVGGSSTDDNRKTTTSPDGECWGANYGEDTYDGVTTGVSVVAPCVACPTTDRQGTAGYNNNGTVADPWACVSYPGQPASGNYMLNFDGTSAATPHVAGFAALIRSQYPLLRNVEVRNIIERTAAKVGTASFAENENFPNGTRNQEIGYGRIDAFRGLDFADVMIKDWSGDDGTEPSSPPSNNWWSYSDIVIRNVDDNLFNPDNASESKNVERGQTNYIYVRVTNNGPNDARNVVVDFRVTPYVGLQFVYPGDWSFEDSMHVKPTPVVATFAIVPSGSSVIAKFTITSAQTDILYGWEHANPWHPCLLAKVTSDNDYAFDSSDLGFGNLVLRKNNIAQRNLSVIDVLASPAGRTLSSPFIAGNKSNKERKIYLEVDRTKLPENVKAYLSLDDDGAAFPKVEFKNIDYDSINNYSSEDSLCVHQKIVLLNRTRIKTNFGNCDGVLILEKGSTLQLLNRSKKNDISNIKGGNLIIENGKRMIEITNTKLLVEMEKQQGEILPMSVRLIFPSGLTKGKQYALSVSQKDSNYNTVGGGDFVYILS